MDKIAKWTPFIVDVEANGPIPGDYSMIEIGVLKLGRELTPTFYSKIKPVNNNFVLSALASIGVTHEETMNYKEDPKYVMANLRMFILLHTEKNTWPMMFSDNNGFDFMFTHYYFEHFLGLGYDPFGHTSRNIADIFRGLDKNVTSNFKKLRKTKHSHNPVDDAIGNAEALIAFIDQYGLMGLKI